MISICLMFFEEMNITPPYNHLGVEGFLHGAMTGRMLKKIEEVFLQERPSAVLVYGDTNSTLVGALAAVKLNVVLFATNSGVMQKEANFFRVPCNTLREETEWVELLIAGWNYLCPPKTGEEIYETIMERIGQSGDIVSLYGNGKTAELIVIELEKLVDSK